MRRPHSDTWSGTPGNPTAPRKIDSKGRSCSRPSSGIMRPVRAYVSQLQSKSFHSKSKPKRRPAASRTRIPSGSTSLPIPSPGITAIRCRMLVSSVDSGLSHGLHDVGEQLLGEIRRDLGRGHVGLDLVQVLQAQDVVADEIGHDTGEEEAEPLERGAEPARAWIGQRQVQGDPVDASQAQLAQTQANDVHQVGAIGGDADHGLAPLGEDVDPHLGRAVRGAGAARPASSRWYAPCWYTRSITAR